MGVRVLFIALLLIVPTIASARTCYVQDMNSYEAGYAEFQESVISSLPSNVSVVGNPLGGAVIAWNSNSATLYTERGTVNVEGPVRSAGFVYNTTQYWYVERESGLCEVYDISGELAGEYHGPTVLHRGEILVVSLNTSMDRTEIWYGVNGTARVRYEMPWDPEWFMPVYGGLVAVSGGRAFYHNGTVHELPVDDVEKVIPTPFRPGGEPMFIALTTLYEEGVKEYIFRFVTPREVLGSLKTFTPPIGYAFGANGTVVIADRTHMYIFRNICEPFIKVKHSFSFITTWNFTEGVLAAVEGETLISMRIWPGKVLAWGTDVDGDGVLRDEDADDDGDGMPDAWEERHGLDPWTNDSVMDGDGDKLTNYAEYLFGTDPSSPDTDGDELDDYLEFVLGTNGTNPDTDGDGLTDGYEVRAGTDPLEPLDAGPASAGVSMTVPALVLGLAMALLSLAFATWKKYK
jgi:hypothetical protein